MGGDDARHITKSLRLRVGDKITVSDNGYDYLCEITRIGDCVQARIEDISKNAAEPNIQVTLFQALPKHGKFELIIEKCVELGVCEIVPIVTDYTIPSAESFDAKNERFNKLSESAAKQSRRGYIPKVQKVITLKDAVTLSEGFDIAITPYEKAEGRRIRDALCGFSGNRAALFIGCEGGFSEREIDILKNTHIVTLGRRILRTETAGFTALTIFFNETGEL